MVFRAPGANRTQRGQGGRGVVRGDDEKFVHVRLRCSGNGERILIDHLIDFGADGDPLADPPVQVAPELVLLNFLDSGVPLRPRRFVITASSDGGCSRGRARQTGSESCGDASWRGLIGFSALSPVCGWRRRPTWISQASRTQLLSHLRGQVGPASGGIAKLRSLVGTEPRRMSADGIALPPEDVTSGKYPTSRVSRAAHRQQQSADHSSGVRAIAHVGYPAAKVRRPHQRPGMPPGPRTVPPAHPGPGG